MEAAERALVNQLRRERRGAKAARKALDKTRRRAKDPAVAAAETGIAQLVHQGAEVVTRESAQEKLRESLPPALGCYYGLSDEGGRAWYSRFLRRNNLRSEKIGGRRITGHDYTPEQIWQHVLQSWADFEAAASRDWHGWGGEVVLLNVDESRVQARYGPGRVARSRQGTATGYYPARLADDMRGMTLVGVISSSASHPFASTLYAGSSSCSVSEFECLAAECASAAAGNIRAVRQPYRKFGNNTGWLTVETFKTAILWKIAEDKRALQRAHGQRFRAIVIMDGAPCHRVPEEDLAALERSDGIRVLRLQPETGAWIQVGTFFLG